jgi:transglutaminase-like putative cysteine protease
MERVMTERPWRLEVRHSTGFRYESDVTASHNEVRLSPQSADGQWVLSHRVDVSPSARLARFTDYWGTVVHAFDLRRAHRELSIVATSQVETTPHSGGAGAQWSWRDLADEDERDVWCEFLMPTDYTASDDTIAGLAELVRAAPDPAAAVDRAQELVRDGLEYRKGVTTVNTNAPEALAAGAGVCQDFVHLTLAVLRAAGVPCRYASGYLSPQAGADIGETVAGESHAWLDAWVGHWMSVDPTNGRPVGPDHVLVARGRDYADVAPLRGVYLGGRAETLDVTVEITRRA